MGIWPFDTLLGSPRQQDVRPSNVRRRNRLDGFEALEDRIVPASHTWSGNATNGLFASNNNWSGGAPTESGARI